jgi:hypothetical protein
VVEKRKKKRPHGRTWHKMEDNIKMDLRSAGYDSVDWMHVARIRSSDRLLLTQLYGEFFG